MSNTDRIRAYYNLHRKCFSVQDYQSGLVIEHTDKLFVTNAMFVVRKSGNERVKQEGKKNVHAFVNGIRSKLKQGMMPEFASYKVRYDPYTMDYFNYRRIVNGNAEWLPVDRHWIGNVYLYISRGKPVIYADIDKLGDTKLLENDKPIDTKEKPLMVIKDETCIKRYYDGGGFSMEFLRRKQKQIENKKKLLAI
jgi:hypothetical protein